MIPRMVLSSPTCPLHVELCGEVMSVEKADMVVDTIGTDRPAGFVFGLTWLAGGALPKPLRELIAATTLATVRARAVSFAPLHVALSAKAGDRSGVWR